MKLSRVLCVLCVVPILVGCFAGAAFAQTSATVQTVNSVSVLSHPADDGTVVATVDANVVLTVLDSDAEWFWVSLPPDGAGARARGWVRGTDVRPSTSIPPTGDAVRRAQAQREQEARERALAESQIEVARQNLEQRRQEYEAVANPGQATTSGATTQPTRAQNSLHVANRPSYEVFGGYSLLFDTTNSVTFPLGWIGSVSSSLTDNISLVGEVSGGYKSQSIVGVTLARESIHAFTAGPRFSRRLSGIASYGQVLAGLTVASANVFGYSASSTAFVVAPGVGFDIPVTQSFAVRVGGESSIVRDSGAWFNEFRLTTGLVLTSKR
jgi:hypothetical protein